MDKILTTFNIQSINNGASTGQDCWNTTGALIDSYSPVDGKLIASVKSATASDYDRVIKTAQAAFLEWRQIPAPKRGEVVRQLAERIRFYKEPLGKLVSYEMGKSLQEGLGEVQEMIDICDFAVGLSRQLYGLTMHSERPSHRMYEQYHPLGIVGIISAFNFPVAVWNWNTALAWVCGDVCVWKPSEKTPLTALACQFITNEVFKENNVPEGVSSLVIGDAEIGKLMANDARVPLISATGSTRMGKSVGALVGARLGRALLELGGNNAIIIAPSADLKVVVPGAVFGAVGTAGQRCTSTRRLIIHEDIYEKVRDAIVKAYGQLKIGDPLNTDNHVGPLIDKDAVNNYLVAIEKAKAEGATVLIDGEVLTGDQYTSGCYVKPVILEAENHFSMVQHETFAPILYLMKYTGDVSNAVALQNNVPQGLSSAIMTNNLKEAEAFFSGIRI